MQATNDNADALGTSNQIPAAAVQRGESLGSCGTGFQQVRVVMTRVDQTTAPALQDHGFYVWFA